MQQQHVRRVGRPQRSLAQVVHAKLRSTSHTGRSLRQTPQQARLLGSSPRLACIERRQASRPPARGRGSCVSSRSTLYRSSISIHSRPRNSIGGARHAASAAGGLQAGERRALLLAVPGNALRPCQRCGPRGRKAGCRRAKGALCCRGAARSAALCGLVRWRLAGMARRPRRASARACCRRAGAPVTWRAGAWRAAAARRAALRRASSAPR